MYVGFPFRRFTSAETLGHLSFAFRSSRPLNQVTQKSCSLSHACRWGPFPSLPQGHTHRTCTHSHTLRHTNTCAPYMLMHPHTHSHTHTPRHTNTCAPYILTHLHTHMYIHTHLPPSHIHVAMHSHMHTYTTTH